MQKFEPLAIVGIGCLFPKSDGLGAYWANVKHGVDCISPVPPTHWNPDDYFDADPKAPDKTYARRGGFLDVIDFNPLEFGIAPRDLEATDTSQLLGLVAAKRALQDANVQFNDSVSGVSKKRATTDRNRVSIILGVTGTLELVIPLGARLGHPKWKRAMKDAGIPDAAADDAAQRIADSYVPWQENSFPGLLGNVVAGRIANRLDLGGTNCVVDAACASSLSAVHLASLELQAGRADVVVTGGVDTFNDIFMYMCFSKTPALSPTGDAKPFDANSDGTILGEGLGVVVLKRLADAERDGDRIYAVLKGVGSSSDGKGNAIYAPSAAGQVKAIQNAYRIADVTPDTIELVEAHGTGTKVGDTVEAKALTEVYGQAAGTKPRPWVAVGSVKSQIGHTKAAAGAASLIKAALALYFKVLPPTAKVTEPVEPFRAADSPFYVNATMRPWLPRADHPRRAALSAFGFGGSNFHAVLEEHTPEKTEVDWDGSVELFAISGLSASAIASELDRVQKLTTWPEFAQAADASRSRFDVLAPCRLVLAVSRDRTDRTKLLAATKAKLVAEPTAAGWSTPDGAHYGTGLAGKLAVLFPGQGSQSVGMLRDLACLFPEVLECLEAANDAVHAQLTDETDGRRLTDRIYPPTSFAKDAASRQDATVRATETAQPALGAVSFGAWRVLSERFGLTADAFAGHSYGELPALAAAGRIAPGDLFALSRLRGRLMAQSIGDAGAMLAVLASAADVEAVIAAEQLNLVIANRNAPAQVVLSGATAEIDRAEQVLAVKRYKAIRLPVSRAFHSPLVSDAADPFRAALDGVEFAPARKPIFANTTAQEYPADESSARDVLGFQLAEPVLFADTVRALYFSGVRTFVEVGPAAVLTRLVEATLPECGPGAVAVALDPAGGKRSGVLDLGNLLGRLAARGHAVRLTAWEAGSRCRPAAGPKPGLTIPICGANHVTPRPVRSPSASRLTVSGGPIMPPVPGPAGADPSGLAQALSLTQQTLAALQQMQEQTAALHRQFLESQEQAQRTLAHLVAQQQALLFPGGAAPQPAPVMAPIPAPRPVPTPVVAPRNPPPPVAVVRPAAPSPSPVPVPTKNGTYAPAAGDSVAKLLLDVVAEKTGYPVSTLNLEMTLDSDLGVDSIKRVEILSSLQEKLPNAPTVKPEHLGTLHTLQDIADFLAAGTEPRSVPADPMLTVPTPVNGTRALSPHDSGVFPFTHDAAFALPTADDVRTLLLEVVAEKTGYPVSTLNLDMTLDSDLGVDSIKRVEILSSLQEKLPNAPTVKPEHLGTLHTLNDIAEFLAAGVASPSTVKVDLASISALPSPDESLQAAATTRQVPIRALSRALPKADPSVSELLTPKTEQVKNVLPTSEAPRPAAPPPRSFDELDAAMVTNRLPIAPINMDRIDRSILQAVDLDITAGRPRLPLPEGGELWVVAPDDALTRETLTLLSSHGFTIKQFPWVDPGIAATAGNPAGLILIAPVKTGSGPSINKLAFRWLQTAGPKLRGHARHSSAALVATVARLDGAFGLGDTDAKFDPIPGGLAGLIKTARYEWPELGYKAIDLAATFGEASPGTAAAALVDELLLAGPIEVGIAATHRCTLELGRTIRRPMTSGSSLTGKDVVLVTGGARGVTAEVAIALAEIYQPTIVLTGRTPLPVGPEPEWLRTASDEPAMKKAIAEHLGATAAPKAVGEFYARTVAQREVAATLARIERTGAKVAYHAVNVANGRQISDLVHQVQVKFGPITALVHGAGVLADRKIEELTPEQFDTVYTTKVDGVRTILDLLANQEMKAILFFSSTTARFGRAGQLAYAMANEVLNKIAQVEARKRPTARVVAMNWGPWEGGMVTPTLRRLFESEGIGLIPLIEGGVFGVQELTAAGKAVEVIALGKPGRATKLGTSPASGDLRGQPTPPPGLLGATSVAPVTHQPAAELVLAFERTLDIPSHAVLKSHVLDGRAVLPMALHMEWLAHAALHGTPGLVFHGFNDLRITHGVMVEDGGTTTLRALAGRAVKHDKFFHVPVELRGKRRDGRDVLHSRAEVVLSAALPKPPYPEPAPIMEPYPHPVEEVYRYFLFHGPDLQGIEKVDGLADTSFTGTAYPTPPPAEWFTNPLRSAWVTDPLVLDTSFQMMILWSFAQHGAGSLPCFAGRYRQYRRTFPTSPVRIVIRVTRDNGSFARADIDYLDSENVLVAQVQDYECVIDRQLDQAFRRNQLAPKVRQ